MSVEPELLKPQLEPDPEPDIERDHEPGLAPRFVCVHGLHGLRGPEPRKQCALSIPASIQPKLQEMFGDDDVEPLALEGTQDGEEGEVLLQYVGYRVEFWRDAMLSVSKHGLHRKGDKPALVRGSFQKAWFHEGVMHRDNDMPANIIDFSDYSGFPTHAITSRGFTVPSHLPKVAVRMEEWVKRGSRHRDRDDAPAVIIIGSDFVEKQWFHNGLRHRGHGKPAYEMTTLHGAPLVRAWFLWGHMTNQPGGGPAYESYVSTVFRPGATAGAWKASEDICDICISLLGFCEQLEQGITVRPRKVAEPSRGVFEHTPVSNRGQPVEQAWVSWPEVVFGVDYIEKVVVNFCGETFVYKKTRPTFS